MQHAVFKWGHELVNFMRKVANEEKEATIMIKVIISIDGERTEITEITGDKEEVVRRRSCLTVYVTDAALEFAQFGYLFGQFVGDQMAAAQHWPQVDFALKPGRLTPDYACGQRWGRMARTPRRGHGLAGRVTRMVVRAVARVVATASVGRVRRVLVRRRTMARRGLARMRRRRHCWPDSVLGLCGRSPVVRWPSAAFGWLRLWLRF